MRQPLEFTGALTSPTRYLVLSFLGIVIGHEIAHSIDINSRKHITERSDIMLNKDFNTAYKQKAQCFAEKYSSFKVDEAEQNVSNWLCIRPLLNVSCAT